MIRLNHNLYTLLKPWVSSIPKYTINGKISVDSRVISSGDLFIAVKGHNLDGRKFIKHAIEQGASAVLVEAQENNNGKIEIINNIPLIHFSNLSYHLSALASRFYNNPADNIKLIGVTGTNGKTTVAYLITQWAYLLGEISAIMGTLGNGFFGSNLEKTLNTTNSAIDIQRLLYNYSFNNASLAVLEVSSHGLIQRRTVSLFFKVAIFTNLSHDHLDYHKDIINYEAAKWKMFSEHKIENIVINIDDKYGFNWSKKLSFNTVVVTLNQNLHLNHYKKWLRVLDIQYFENGTVINFQSSWGNGVINSRLLGIFNVSNIMLALATMLVLGYDLYDLLKVSSKLLPANGRMELLSHTKRPKVFLDYAHTPDALKSALIALNLHYKARIWCIFGCGGDRDKSKRSIMGAIAEKYSDVVIVTSDNPRSENQKNIANEILAGMLYPSRARVILDRAQAILYGITKSNSNDIVLIAGKGHENYQIINDHFIEYSDRTIAMSILKTLK